MATQAQRQHMAALMDWLVAHERLMHYVQKRPMSTANILEQQLSDKFANGGTISTDCSETVTLICRLAGLSDPNGQAYNGYGFTGTMLSTLKHYIDPAAADVGALVVFGPGDGHHVAMVRKKGHDPLLFSHGKESDPQFVRLSEEKKAQKLPTTFLSIAQL